MAQIHSKNQYRNGLNSKENFISRYFDAILAVFIVSSFLFSRLISGTPQSQQLEMLPVTQQNPVTVALVPQNATATTVGHTNTISLKVTQTYNNSTVAIRGLMFRIKVSDPAKLNLNSNSIVWGDKFANVSGVKYATYNQSTGNLDIAVANNADIQIAPDTSILSFGVSAGSSGTFTLAFDPNFAQTDITNSSSQSLLDKVSLSPLSLVFSSGTGGNTSLNSITLALAPSNSGTTALGQANKITLRVSQTANSSPINIRGLSLQLKIADPTKLNLSSGSIVWGDKFTNISGAKYAVYKSATGLLDIAIANNTDIAITPNTPILSFDVSSSTAGTYSLGFNTSFAETKIVNTNNQNLINLNALSSISINFGAAASFSCTGTVPSNSTLCTGDTSNLTANTAITVVTSCTNETKCEYFCNSGYVKSGSNCVSTSSGTFSCTGNTPDNATLCNGDDSSLSNNVEKSLVSNCSNNAKCEYVCNSGYYKSGSGCAKSEQVADPGAPKSGNMPFIWLLFSSLVAIGSIGGIAKLIIFKK